ncbi:MAG: hypothetical protein HFH13_14025 [Dorea sp.]|nr:hypothetical protein [Dorea sp.]
MSNKYDKLYDFRIATVEDIDNIMKFIHDEWGENHILAHDKKLFTWQYGSSEYGDNTTINVVLMTKKDGEIVGMIGFVPYSDNREHLHISTAITKVSSRNVIPMSGIELMKRQVSLVGEEANFASGTNPGTILPFFEKVFKHKVGIMQQYFILNEEIKDFKVARPDLSDYKHTFIETAYSLYEVNGFQELSRRYDLNEMNKHMSIKSPEYVRKRFFEHPYYTYKKWVVMDEKGNGTGVIFGREIEIENTKILRFVDYRGELSHLEKIGSAVHDLIRAEGYEYVDLMASDLTEIKMDEAGFNLLDPDGKTIIPHYFEPFVQENIKNYYQTNYDLVIFKADGDQDRPNRI